MHENQSVRPVSANTEALTPSQIYEKNVPAILDKAGVTI